MQILVVGQSTVFSGHGSHIHAHVLVTELFRPYKYNNDMNYKLIGSKIQTSAHGRHFLGLQCSIPPILHIHCEQSSFWNTFPTAYLKNIHNLSTFRYANQTLPTVYVQQNMGIQFCLRNFLHPTINHHYIYKLRVPIQLVLNLDKNCKAKEVKLSVVPL